MEGIVHIWEVEENAYNAELGEEVEEMEEVGNAGEAVGILDSRQGMGVVGNVGAVGIVDSRQEMAEVGMEVVVAVYSQQVGKEVAEIEKVDSRQVVGRVMEEGVGVVVEAEVEEMVMGVEVEEMVMGVGVTVVEVVMVMGAVERVEEEEEETVMVEGEEMVMVAEEGEEMAMVEEETGVVEEEEEEGGVVEVVVVNVVQEMEREDKYVQEIYPPGVRVPAKQALREEVDL